MKRTTVVRDYGGKSADDRRAERRRQLVAAARHRWGESGIAGVTVRRVCADSGLVSRYFYEHFDHRDAVVGAVYDEVSDHLIDAMLAAGLEQSGGIYDKVRAALAAYLNLVAADPHIHRIMASDLGSVAGLDGRRARGVAKVTRLILSHAPALLAENVSPQDLRRGTLFVVGGVNQITQEWLVSPVETPDELAQRCATLCMAVVNSRPPDHR